LGEEKRAELIKRTIGAEGWLSGTDKFFLREYEKEEKYW